MKHICQSCGHVVKRPATARVDVHVRLDAAEYDAAYAHAKSCRITLPELIRKSVRHVVRHKLDES